MVPLLRALLALRSAQALRLGSSWGAPPPADYSFARFARDHGRSYPPGSAEWRRREELFRGRLQEVSRFYTGPAQSWNKGITGLMDYTEDEYRRLLGYKGRGGRQRASAATALGRRAGGLPDAFSVLANASALTGHVRDQGTCGSCWAVAALAVLEGHVERSAEAVTALKGVMSKHGSGDKLPMLSDQAMVSCTSNPRHCGGTGGCDGATSELGFEMVKARGLPLGTAWPYSSGDSGSVEACDAAKFASTRVTISGYTVLPSNKFLPLKQALVDIGGPIVITVDATNWMLYSGGIYTDNGKEWTVNHAVTLVGFKEPKGTKQGYWHIKNSWGTWWGESGFIRVEMKQNEEKHCGWDHDTHIGIACDGEPNDAWVCGTCGILYDSSYPTGVRVAEGA